MARSAVDGVVHSVVVELALSTGRRIVDPVVAEEACLEQGFSHDEWFSAVAALKTQGLVALQTAPQSQVVLLAATNAGILRYLETTAFDLTGARERLSVAVREAELKQALPLAEAADLPALLVECLLDGWVDRRLVVYSQAPGRRFRIHRVSQEWPGSP